MFSGNQSSGRRQFLQTTIISAGLVFVALFLGFTGGCSNSSSSGGGPVVVPLEYTPEHARDSIKPYPGDRTENRIFVGRFEDKREKTDAIGVNVEHQNPVQIVPGSDPVEFFRQTLAKQLRNAGLKVVDDPSQADRIINGDLTRFWVEESSSYKADVGATIRVTDKGGMSRWSGEIVGKGETFGRSLSPENYRQCLSDAMVRLTYESLLTNSEFQNAIK